MLQMWKDLNNSESIFSKRSMYAVTKSGVGRKRTNKVQYNSRKIYPYDFRLHTTTNL